MDVDRQLEDAPKTGCAAPSSAGEDDERARREVPSQEETGVLSDDELAAIREHNDFIRAADAALTDVRQRSYEGKITTSSRWAKRSFAPEGMDSSKFEERLLLYIEEHDHAEAKPVMGRIDAPAPLGSQPDDAGSSEEERLPDLDVSDIAMMPGKRGIYLYSVALLSHSFARALFLTAENDDVATFVDVVRTESSVYPRPVAIDCFMNPPYLWSIAKTRQVFEKTKKAGSFKDIDETSTSTGVTYYYSDLYLSAAQARSLAEWYGVEQRRNP